MNSCGSRDDSTEEQQTANERKEKMLHYASVDRNWELSSFNHDYYCSAIFILYFFCSLWFLLFLPIRPPSKLRDSSEYQKKKKNMENWIHQVIMTHSRAAVGKKSAHFFVCLQQFPAMFNESTASTKTIVNKFAHVIWNSHNFWTCNWCLSTLLLLHTHLLLGFFHIYLYSAV